MQGILKDGTGKVQKPLGQEARLQVDTEEHEQQLGNKKVFLSFTSLQYIGPRPAWPDRFLLQQPACPTRSAGHFHVVISLLSASSERHSCYEGWVGRPFPWDGFVAALQVGSTYWLLAFPGFSPENFVRTERSRCSTTLSYIQREASDEGDTIILSPAATNSLPVLCLGICPAPRPKPTDIRKRPTTLSF